MLNSILDTHGSPRSSLLFFRSRKISSRIAVNRAEYFLVHTPQCFATNILKQAYAQPFAPVFTDDASVVEAIGIEPLLVMSNEENIKITSQLDLQLLNALLK